MNQQHTRFTGVQTVNEIVRQCPQTIAVFNEFGIDSCCGGGVAIEVAADRDGVDPEVLLRRLNDVAEKS